MPSRLSDLPDPHAIIVLLPGSTPGSPPITRTVNGRIARMIAWLLDHRSQIELIRGSIVFNCGDRGWQVELREMFPYQNVPASKITELPGHAALDTRIRASDEFNEDQEAEDQESEPRAPKK